MRPNVEDVAALAVRSARTGIVALVMPDLRAPSSAEVSQHLVEPAHRRGLAVRIEQSWDDLDRTREQAYAKTALEHLVSRIDGSDEPPMRTEVAVGIVERAGTRRSTRR